MTIFNSLLTLLHCSSAMPNNSVFHIFRFSICRHRSRVITPCCYKIPNLFSNKDLKMAVGFLLCCQVLIVYLIALLLQLRNLNVCTKVLFEPAITNVLSREFNYCAGSGETSSSSFERIFFCFASSSSSHFLKFFSPSSFLFASASAV